MEFKKPYRNNLSLFQRVTYDQILKGLFCLRESIKVFDSDIDSLNNIIESVKLDTPTLYYVGSFQYQLFKGLHYAILHPKYEYSGQQIESINQQLSASINQLKGTIQASSERDKVVAIHDALCSKIFYREYGQEAHSVIGALLCSEAVCEGISKTFKLLCDELDIECCVVQGQAKSDQIIGNENHSWNKVKIDSKWLNVDVTFDLTMSPRGHIRHDYLFLSDNAIKGTHFQSRGAEFVSDINQSDYFTANKLVMANQQQLVDYVKTSIGMRKFFIEIKLPETRDIKTVEQKVINSVRRALTELNVQKQINIGSNKELLVFTIELL